MDRISSRLTRPQRKLCRKRRLVASVLLSQIPRARAEPQHRSRLPLHPALIVGRHAAARGDLVQSLRSSARADGDECGTTFSGIGEEAGVEEVAELDGIVGCEGGEDETIAADISVD